MVRFAARVAARLGRRGAVLLVLGTLWVLIGAAVATTAPGADPEHLPHLLLPHWVRVGKWAIAGVVAVAAGLQPRGRPDWWGFATLVVPPIIRAVSYLWAWVAWVLPGVPGGFGTAWIGAAEWGVILALILIVAGWPEPPGTR